MDAIDRTFLSEVGAGVYRAAPENVFCATADYKWALLS